MSEELKAYKGDVYIPVYGSIADAEVYLKKDVDEVIAQLKNKIEDVQASAYAESIDVGMENRILKRALWMHRAITAKFNKEACKAMREYNPFIGIEEYKWQEAERKCRAKAEEYK